ncbi:MAG: hypothetical protein RL223_3419 [Pseudomonadota bacterium]|jgi:AraC-like DNA-binding protein
MSTARALAPLTASVHQPTAARPLRARLRRLDPHERVDAHRHDWAQLAFALEGVTRLQAEHGTYLVPPSRALWIPPGVEHAVTVLEPVTLVTLYLHQEAGVCGPWTAAELAAAMTEAGPPDLTAWHQCRVLEVSALTRALVEQLDPQADRPLRGDEGPQTPPPPAPDARSRRREDLLAALLRDELRRAAPVPLGVPMPQDKRLRALCQAVLDAPCRHATLADWSRDVGASPRTLARLFQQQLSTRFGLWREQVLLAQALSLAAQGRPMAWIAAELGYAHPSAFSAMVRRQVGMPPSRFFAGAAVTPASAGGRHAR